MVSPRPSRSAVDERLRRGERAVQGERCQPGDRVAAAVPRGGRRSRSPRPRSPAGRATTRTPVSNGSQVPDRSQTRSARRRAAPRTGSAARCAVASATGASRPTIRRARSTTWIRPSQWGRWARRTRRWSVAAAGCELEHAGVAVDDDRAPVDAPSSTASTPGIGAGGEVARASPASRADRRTGGARRRPPSATSRSARRRRPRSSLGAAWNVVRHARLSWRTLPKPGGERDVGDGEVGVVEQAAGEVGAARAGQLVGRDAEVLREQAAQVAAGDAEAGARGRPRCRSSSAPSRISWTARHTSSGPDRSTLGSLR